MNYNDIYDKKLNTSDGGTYPNYLHIRDEQATTETLAHFLDTGEENTTITNFSIYSSNIKILPKGLFKYLKNLKVVQLTNCHELETIEDIPESADAIEINITNCPKLTSLPNTLWNHSKLKKLHLFNLPMLQISQTTVMQQDWHLPQLKGLSLVNVPIRKLPAIHADLLYNFSIKTDGFEEFSPHQPKLPKLDSLTIKSKVFKDLKHLEDIAYLQFLELHDIETTLDWSDLLQSCHATFLTICNCHHFTTSKTIESNSKIRILHLKDCQVLELPEFIGKCRGLNQLLLSNCPIASLPDGLAEKKRMAEIRLYKCSFKEIPPVIFKIPLECFSLNDNQVPLVTIPKDWSGCANLWRLELRNNNYHFSDLNFLDDLPKLKFLQIDGNSLEDRYSLLRKKKLPLQKESYDIFKGCKYTKRKEIVSACRALANAPIAEKDKRYFLDRLWDIKRMSDFPKLSDDLLLKGLCVSWSPMQTQFKEILAQRIEEHNQQSLAFSADSVVGVIGKLTLKKAALSKKVESIGAQYAAKFSKQLSHVIIGKHPTQFDLFEYKNMQFCTEQQFQTYLSKENPSFLQQPDNVVDQQIIENLYVLLKNPKPANFEIAIQILKNGGVPNGMLEDLLILQKTHESAIVRGKIKNLLKLYGPATWLPILNDRHSFYKVSTGTEQEWVITKKLRKIAMKTAPKYAVILSILLYKKFGKGLRYALLQQGKVEEDLYQGIIDDLVQAGTLNWSKAIGMRQDEKLNYAGEYAHSYYTKVAKIPVKLLEHTVVSTINLYDCGLEKVPKEIFEFPQVKAINLAKNKLTELPNDFKKLKNLTELDLSDNQFDHFPAVLSELKQLKQLNFSGNLVMKKE